MKLNLLLALVAMSFSVTFCAIAQINLPGDPCTNCPPPEAIPPQPPPEGWTVIEFGVRHIGALRLELFDRDKPASVRNFLNYVFTGAYSNSFLHRASSNSLVQGGSLQIIDFGGGSKAVVPVTEGAAVTNEVGVGRFFSNLRGTITLAHYPGETNNATCHWFINLADNTYLDAAGTNYNYTVFGRVIGGLENLDKLNPASPTSAVKILNLGGWLDELPVRPSATPSTVSYDDLLIITNRIVTLDMWLQMERIGSDTRRLSWRSVSNRQHTAFFVPQLGGTWSSLWTTNGNGSNQWFDHTTNASGGFYRVSYQP